MSASNELKVMAAGHLCIDITPRFPGSGYEPGKMFSPGAMTTVGEAVFSTGGTVSNTGLAMERLGMDVALNGKVGDDVFGAAIKKLVGEKNAKSLKVVSGQNTSYTLVFSVPGVDRFFMHNPGTNDTFGPEDVDYEAAGACRLFHFGYPPLMKRMYENGGAELVEIYKRVRGLGVTTSLDMALPDPSGAGGQVDWRGILEKVLPYVDIFVPSIEEIAFMLDRDLFESRKAQAGGGDPVLAYEERDCVDIAEMLHSMGVKIVVIKCGVRGVYLDTSDAEDIGGIGPGRPKEAGQWANRRIWAGSFKTENFVSALGAGDATIAGFLCGLLRGFSPEETLNIANIVGCQNVQAVDALSGIGNWQSVIEGLGVKGRARNEAGVDEKLWRYCAEREVYYGPGDKRNG